MKLRSPLPQRKARLEIIPLIDIMFFLLASFMLVSLSMTKLQTVKVDLPAAAATQNNFKPDKINLAVTAEGDYYLGTDLVSLPELERELAQRKAGDPDIPVFISGDDNSRHGSSMRLLGVLQRLGFKSVTFLTKKSDAS